MKSFITTFAVLGAIFCISSCQSGSDKNTETAKSRDKAPDTIQPVDTMQQKLDQYKTVALDADLSHLSEVRQSLIKHLIKAAREMDKVFWQEAYGDRRSLMNSLQDSLTRKYAKINYGPWDRLNNNAPFVEDVGKKPEGANFYPSSMTKTDFKQADLEDKKSLYTLIREDANGDLRTVWYSEAFQKQHEAAAGHLLKAAELAKNEGLKHYLEARANALKTDEYQTSDSAWLTMKDNLIDVVIGPIETYEDNLFGYKAAHEAFVLLKDQEWSEKLSRFSEFLPFLQDSLPVPPEYKQEEPGRDAELNAYQVLYYAGDANAGPKTIAINLPNNEELQQSLGSRRLQLKNAMRAKFEKILQPISKELIAKEQRKYLTFDAFFGNTMFHEVAHGLGLNETINGKGKVRTVLKEHASAIEEGKADILGLYMIKQLHEKGELDEPLQNYYTTFMASIFRSIRFGAASAHGKANMIRFNDFMEKGAFERQDNGTYRINFEQLEEAMTSLSKQILQIQGDGDYKAAQKLVREKGQIGHRLQEDLQRLDKNNIPIDIRFNQGIEYLKWE